MFDLQLRLIEKKIHKFIFCKIFSIYEKKNVNKNHVLAFWVANEKPVICPKLFTRIYQLSSSVDMICLSFGVVTYSFFFLF